MAILERISQQLFGRSGKAAIPLSEDLVIFLEGENREEALHKLVDALHQTGKVDNPDEFYEAILNREKIVSTGIGMGIAIPHAKLNCYDDFFLAIGIQKKEGIEWEALDELPVQLILMIGGPDDRQTEYLQILSRLTSALKEKERRNKLFAAKSAKEVLDLMNEI